MPREKGQQVELRNPSSPQSEAYSDKIQLEKGLTSHTQKVRISPTNSSSRAGAGEKNKNPEFLIPTQEENERRRELTSDCDESKEKAQSFGPIPPPLLLPMMDQIIGAQKRSIHASSPPPAPPLLASAQNERERESERGRERVKTGRYLKCSVDGSLCRVGGWSRGRCTRAHVKDKFATIQVIG